MYPYTGETIAKAFLTGLEVKQVMSWLKNKRKKYDPMDLDPVGTERDPIHAKRIIRAYKADAEGFARGVVCGDIDPGTGAHRVARERPRFSLVKA